jgi:hypothetical protein
VYDGYVDKLQLGSVGKLEPDANETCDIVSKRISRAAKRRGIAIDVWEDGGAIWFKRTP